MSEIPPTIYERDGRPPLERAGVPKKKAKKKASASKKAAAVPKKTAKVDYAPGTEGMTPEMALAVSKVIFASGGKVWIKSGTRTRAEQQRLYDKYKRGEGNLTAKPGSSRHEHGLAVDFGGDLKLAAKLAKQFGLSSTVKGEPWHFSIGGPEGKGGGGGSGTGGGAGHDHAPVAGGAASGGAIPDLAPDATQAQITAHIRRYYPQAAPFLQIPEIAAIFTAPGAGEMDSIELEAKLRATKYWQTHGRESRALDALFGSDRQAADKLINDTKRTFKDMFARQGITLTDEQASLHARKMIRAGYVNLNGQITDPDAINDLMVADLRAKGGGLPQGEASGTADAMVAMAKQYLVPISRADAEAWSLRILDGSATDESFRSWLTGLAKARYASQPDILAALDAGMTPSAYFSGHRNTVASLLEVDPNQIDLTDHKWSWMLETVDKNGNRRAPTLGEVQQLARDRPEFAGTQAYRETSSEYALGMAKFIGAAA